MPVAKHSIGRTADGQEVDSYTVANANGLQLRLMTYGATITSVEVPDRHGQRDNITLSLDSLADYFKGHPCFGSTIGRFANRIAKGRFSIDGRQYKVATNNGPNHLHGGIKGFDKVVWAAKPVEGAGFAGVALTYRSVDGEEGYPGNLIASVTYGLTDSDELRMEYSATTDQPTIVNLTNHAYWNLAGRGVCDVLGHELMINADRYLPTDEGLIPVGELREVRGTPTEFTQAHAINSRIRETGGGYDHCYVLNKSPGQTCPSLAARVFEPTNGRVMEIFTTEPGIQLYTANGLDGTLQGGGCRYYKHFGLCLEAQHFPDSPNKPHFPSTVLRPGETYRQLTVHKFSIGRPA